MKNCLYLILISCLLGCRYFNVSPVNGISLKNVPEKPNDNDLIGTWEVDKTTYDLVEKKGYKNPRKIELKLNNDKTFEAKNFPDFAMVFDSRVLKAHQLKGKWNVAKDFEETYFVLELSFDKIEDSVGGFSTSYDLYLQDSKLIIWDFIGDPDSGERFLFEKINSR
jgi:hypothetical protein